MAKVKLSDMSFGLDSKPEINLEHDSKILLETAFNREKGEYSEIPINKIIFNPDNDYADTDTEKSISELANDIKHNGLLHNIVVSARDDGMYLLLSGERRLRAYKWLLEEYKDNKYSVIHAKVLKNLSKTEEMIILDAANLHVRGGTGNETRFRKAMVRFVKNLQIADRITEDEAKKMTAESFEDIDKRLIGSNLTIENDLIPELLELLDKDLIPKRQAILYARLEPEVQSEIAATISSANEKGRGELKETNDRLREAMKKVGNLSAQLENHQKGKAQVESELKTLLEMGDSDELSTEQTLARIQALTAEKKRYTAAIKQAKIALEQNKAEMTIKPADTSKNAVAAQINKNIGKLVSGVNSVSSLNVIRCIKDMDKTGKQVVVERLTAAKKQLEDLIEEIGEG